MERLYRGTVKQRETVGKIMESIVLLKYPLETESITFNDLLEWELWPSFIKIFSELLYSIMHALVYSYHTSSMFFHNLCCKVCVKVYRKCAFIKNMTSLLCLL